MQRRDEFQNIFLYNLFTDYKQIIFHLVKYEVYFQTMKRYGTAVGHKAIDHN